MGGVISFRADAAERRKLRALMQERGCANMSQVVRLMLGFPRDDGHEPFEGSGDIDSVSTLTQAVMRSIDRQDDAHEILSRIARHLGVPTETRGGSFDTASPGPVDPRQPFPTRGGHDHPDLPPGFAR
jgi:hypothetical protein